MKQTVRTAVLPDGNTQMKCVRKGRRSEAKRPWIFILRHAVVGHVLKRRLQWFMCWGVLEM